MPRRIIPHQKMSEISEIKGLLKKLEPVVGRKAKVLWRWQLLSRSPGQRQASRNLLRLLADKKVVADHQEPIRLPPPVPEKLLVTEQEFIFIRQYAGISSSRIKGP